MQARQKAGPLLHPKAGETSQQPSETTQSCAHGGYGMNSFRAQPSRHKGNGVYWGYNPVTNHLLTSWDIQVDADVRVPLRVVWQKGVTTLAGCNVRVPLPGAIFGRPLVAIIVMNRSTIIMIVDNHHDKNTRGLGVWGYEV